MRRAENGSARKIGHLEVVHDTGLVLFQIVLWDCLENEFSYGQSKKWQHPHNSPKIQFDTTLVQTLKQERQRGQDFSK